ncbi:FixJ family two-component response regulator [Pseudomonas graminis]|uniref:response regulator transcription factor n=1 Tax=Pseudomonas graminis TaxID=158627 RepID=UPI0010EFB913|nr:response regulator [Pseudomonas graminis]TDV56707.1 FixJ family two-component response regulator [Pseudomonas graminis]
MSVNPKVYVVDDDAAIRTSLQRLLNSADIVCEVFDSAQAFLDRPLSQGPVCLLLDVNLAQGTGFDLQQTLLGRGQTFPIIFMTGYGTIAMSVRAIKAGAREFLTKPFEPEQLLDLVREALSSDATSLDERCLTACVKTRFDSLTPRERQVMALLITGQMNKQIAAQLGTSEVTAKVHKRHVLTKMNARNVIELLKMSDRLGCLVK